MTQQRFSELMEPYLEDDDLHERLFATEMRNLGLFGYGVKSFTLSMIENRDRAVRCAGDGRGDRRDHARRSGDAAAPWSCSKVSKTRSSV